jgi:putative ABC transport system permease protein
VGKQIEYYLPIQNGATDMIAQFFKMALRTFRAKKLYTFINIFALSLAMAIAIVAYLNYDFARGFDRFHTNAEHIYVARSVVQANNTEIAYGLTPRPLGPALNRDIPDIRSSTRVLYSYSALRYEDTLFNEQIYFVDEPFLEMFTFPTLYGSDDALSEPGRILITERLAHKYFGTEDVLDRELTLSLTSGTSRTYSIGAVLRDVPVQSSLQFDVLLPYSEFLGLTDVKEETWAQWTHETFIQLLPASDIQAVTGQLATYQEHQNAALPSQPVVRFYFDHFPDAADRARDLRSDILREGMHPAALLAPSVISVLLLLTAAFNFMNTSLAFSGIRLKEVGVRKVLGSGRWRLAGQFFSENMLLCSVALVIALVLAEFLVPAYSNLWSEVTLELSYGGNWGLLLFLAGVLTFLSIVAASYPALYVSRLNPVDIFQRKIHLSGSNWIIRTVLIFQFTVSTITVIGGVVFTYNASFFNKFDHGYDPEQVIVVPLRGTQIYAAYRHAVEQNPDVLSVAGTEHHLVYNSSSLQASGEGKEIPVSVLSVGDEYVSTMGLNLLQGRDFDKELGTDRSESILIGEKVATDFGWTDPIGKQITLDSLRYSVIGVVQDVYNRGIWRPYDPTILRLAEPDRYRYVVVRTSLSALAGMNEFLNREWVKLVPGIPYEGFYQDESIREAMSVNASIKVVFQYISFTAISIASLGLFALSSLIILKRTKEIGIRKVLGADVVSIVHLLNREIMLILFIASCAAVAAGYFSVGTLMDSIFTYHIDVTFWHLVLATLLTFIVGLITVSTQVLKVATSNPVESLRYE